MQPISEEIDVMWFVAMHAMKIHFVDNFSHSNMLQLRMQTMRMQTNANYP